MRIVLAGLLIASAGALEAQAPAARLPVTDADKEHFLLEGTVERRRAAPGGVTASERVTLALDGLEHDAHVQDIDERKMQVALTGGNEIDFRDSWRGNVAAYRLDRLLGLGMVPVTVVRRESVKEASFTWWVDDFLMDEKTRLRKKVRSPDAEAWNRQMYAVRVFDQLIYNFDRNAGNLLVDKGWRIWMIDHSRSFKTFKDVRSPKSLGTRCPRRLLDGMRRLDKPTLQTTMADLLDGFQIDGLLARRDAIVRHFEEAIARSSEPSVLYDLPVRGPATSAPR